MLSVGITEESRQKLQKIADQYHRNLELLDLTDIRDRFDYEIDTRGFDISAMSRLFIGTVSCLYAVLLVTQKGLDATDHIKSFFFMSN